MEKIRLAIIDNYPFIGKGVKFVIQKCKANYIELGTIYASGEAALLEIAPNKVDVVLLDMLLPDISGIELIAKLLEINPSFKIGIYSSLLNKETITQAFDNGALGYLSKAADSEEFVDFITALAQGQMYMRGEVAQLVVDQQPTQENDSHVSISEHMVEFHKQNIYQKQGIASTPKVVKEINRKDKSKVWAA